MSEVNLRGLIVSKYRTIQKFATEMDWGYRKTQAIVSGKQEPTASDIEKMADALNITVSDEFRKIFFAR